MIPLPKPFNPKISYLFRTATSLPTSTDSRPEIEEVKNRSYPASAHTYLMPPVDLSEFKRFIDSSGEIK